MFDAGLILEGGGMRGVYTAGVLDFFLDKDIWFKNCYAVSAGAGNACSYLSRQRGRALAVNVDYLEDKRYCGLKSLLKTGDLFGADMIYNVIPNELNPIDYDAFRQNESSLYAAVTNCETGKAEYIPIRDLKTDLVYVRASASLPMVSRIVEIGGKKYLDGGVADSIPLKKSIDDGNRLNVLVLTRDQTYKKQPGSFMPAIKLKYKKYPALVKQIERRFLHYNQTLSFIGQEQQGGRALVIRPKKPVAIGRMEKDRKKLLALYADGYRDAQDAYAALRDFLRSAQREPALDSKG